MPAGNPSPLRPSIREHRWFPVSPLAAALLPGAMLVYLSFNAGGFFADTTALVAVALATLLVARILLAPDPIAGMSAGLGAALGALCLYVAWSLISVAWSDAPARALVEFDRTLVYLLGLALFGSFARTAPRVRWLVRGLGLGIAGVCVAGFVSRTVPELWSAVPSAQAPDRLSFPLTYWNAVGAVAAIGFILCFHLSTSRCEPPLVRVAGAAALPVIAATLLLTFSRGAIAVCVVGLIVYALSGRPRALLAGLIAGVAPVAVSVIATYRAGEVATGRMTNIAIQQGHDLALLTLGCAALAAVARALTLPLDRLAPILPWRGQPAIPVRAATAALIVAGLGVALAAGGAGLAKRQYQLFVEGHVEEAQIRDRLGQVGNHGRIAHWDVALRGFREEKLHGQGAGTYPILWSRYRPSTFETTEGHSLYLETLGELGVVGLGLLGISIGALLFGTAARIRGSDRAVYAALFSAMLAWAAYAGIDWLWEMPAVTLWVFCAGGMALASEAPEAADPKPMAPRVRVSIALGLLLLAVTPAFVGISQRQLNDGIRAFKRGDCSAAVGSSLDSISTLSVRPEPYEILGYCDARLGLGQSAIRAFAAAIRRDPRNWELHYGLAVASAGSGRDPRPAARAALRLNPRSKMVEAALERLSTRSVSAWHRWARTAPVPVP